jgi:hypothetical protein
LLIFLENFPKNVQYYKIEKKRETLIWIQAFAWFVEIFEERGMEKNMLDR